MYISFIKPKISENDEMWKHRCNKAIKKDTRMAGQISYQNSYAVQKPNAVQQAEYAVNLEISNWTYCGKFFQKQHYNTK